MNQVVLDIKDRLIKDLQKIFGDKIEKIILYGSYASGEEDSESDIDVMVLVKETSEGLKQYEKNIDELSVNYDLTYMVVLSITIKSSVHFYENIDTIPYYNNLVKEGIALYG